MENKDGMNEKDELIAKVDKQDSIKVARNAKGNHSFEIKLYYCAEKTSAEDVIRTLKNIEDTLTDVFEGKIKVNCAKCGELLFEGTEDQVKNLIIYCEKCVKNG